MKRINKKRLKSIHHYFLFKLIEILTNQPLSAGRKNIALILQHPPFIATTSLDLYLFLAVSIF